MSDEPECPSLHVRFHTFVGKGVRRSQDWHAFLPSSVHPSTIGGGIFIARWVFAEWEERNLVPCVGLSHVFLPSL
jgi:hypothetical protein